MRPKASGSSERDRICIPVPLYHCFGCVLGTMCAAVSGAAMIFPRETFDAAATLEAIEAERCTAIYGVPTMFIVELEHPELSAIAICRRCGRASWRAALARWRS